MPADHYPALGSAALIRQLIPFTIVNFLGFLAVGVPLPVLPIYVKGDLGYGSIVIGIVGALIGGFLSTAMGFGDVSGVNLPSLLIAVLGSLILLIVFRMMRRNA